MNAYYDSEFSAYENEGFYQALEEIKTWTSENVLMLLEDISEDEHMVTMSLQVKHEGVVYRVEATHNLAQEAVKMAVTGIIHLLLNRERTLEEDSSNPPLFV